MDLLMKDNNGLYMEWLNGFVCLAPSAVHILKFWWAVVLAGRRFEACIPLFADQFIVLRYCLCKTTTLKSTHVGLDMPVLDIRPWWGSHGWAIIWIGSLKIKVLWQFFPCRFLLGSGTESTYLRLQSRHLAIAIIFTQRLLNTCLHL